MGYILLALAIFAEVLGTTMLKLSDGFSVMAPTVLYFICFFSSIALLSKTLKYLPLGITYGIWGGMGTALTTIVGVVLWGESFNPAVLLGVGLVIVGTMMVAKDSEPAPAA